jgi:hypothetical protein
MPAITDTQSLESEIVLTERRATTEFRVVEIHESIQNRFVRAEVELGPFETIEQPGSTTEIRGSGRRGVTVWDRETYDAVRDTWTNADLMVAVKAALAA